MTNFRPIFARGGSNGLFSDFLPIRSTKDLIHNYRKTYFRTFRRFWTLKLLLLTDVKSVHAV